ncbi:hypothetical protein [Cyanobium sp. WAJ14-Wanaka]|uniref:hypothetical protein n=1 Tax=Cyanobium sp. WAJ14-Wanaka TaxID=2823725 RepID=UPI0020CC8691|nr:hypothetical protein [Cyanobium sp. WAJ14-Wanaka]MCP9774394.1 hypothetical protein [Cyanobium sp. WAJ14-Wanaka]
MIQDPSSRRQTLLAHNSGIWQGSFIRLDGRCQERERFTSHLLVTEQAGQIEAALTNRLTGSVRSMRFAEPPVEMQISPGGHWSLGPDRIGAWPWVSELCLVWGQQRRRIVLRCAAEKLESVVLVLEGRPGEMLPIPASPLNLTPTQLDGQLVIQADQSEHFKISFPAHRRFGEAQHVALLWEPEPGVALGLARHYGASGQLLSYGLG